MTIRKIVLMGNESLKGIAEPIADPTAPDVAALAQDMRETLKSIDANGLAAPQVEVPKRLVVYRVPAERIPKGAKMTPVPWTVMVNPVIEPQSDEKKPIWERCLSLPGMYGKVPRYTHIRFTFQTLEGTEETHEAKGYHAMLVQHECDHLDGYLYPLRMDDMSQFAFASEIDTDGEFFHYEPHEFYD